MMRRKMGWAVIGMIAAGCQSPSAAPVSPPPAPSPAVVATQQTVTDPRAAAVLKQTQQHVQSISEATFEPPPKSAPAAGTPPQQASSPQAAPPTSPKPQASPVPEATAGGLKPVKSIDKLIQEGVSFAAPGDPAATAAPPTATPAAVAPPATVAPAAEIVAPPPTVEPPAAPVRQAPPALPAAELRKADERVRAAPGDFAAHVDAQLLRVLSGQPPAKFDTLAGLDPEDRDVLLTLVDGVTNFRAQLQGNPNLLPNFKIRPLLAMADRLRAKADLTIVNACLVTKVRGYGSYDAIVPLRLPAGIAHRPAIYYEIENFSSQVDGKGMYRTALRQDVTIYDVNGAAVLQWPNEPVTDLCQRQRHDFYFAKVVRTPINLSAGSYTIKVTLTDNQRMAEASIPLVITPPAAVPQQPRVGGPQGPVGPPGPGGVR